MDIFFSGASGMAAVCLILMLACSILERVTTGRWWWPGRDEDPDDDEW